MKTALFLKSLVVNTGVYTWTSENGWELMPADITQPRRTWLSSQTGISVGAFGAVDIDSFQSLLSNLPSVYVDIIMDAFQEVGHRDYTRISSQRWERLYKPRPVKHDFVSKAHALLAFDKDTGFMYNFNANRDGKGGWALLNEEVSLEGMEKFDMWNYTVYVKQNRTITLPANMAKRLVCATLDQLYCYKPEDDAARSYLVWAQPEIKRLWEG